MTVLGVLSKILVPYAQIIRMRYGRLGHVVFIALDLCQDIFGCASMILTGSQFTYGVSAMHIAAATILLPVGGSTFHLSLNSWVLITNFDSGAVYGRQGVKSNLSNRLLPYGHCSRPDHLLYD